MLNKTLATPTAIFVFLNISLGSMPVLLRDRCVWWAHEMVFTQGLFLCLYPRAERRQNPAGIPALSNIIQADYCDSFFFSSLRATLRAWRRWSSKQVEDRRSPNVTNGPAETGNLPWWLQIKSGHHFRTLFIRYRFTLLPYCLPCTQNLFFAHIQAVVLGITVAGRPLKSPISLPLLSKYTAIPYWSLIKEVLNLGWAVDPQASELINALIVIIFVLCTGGT